MISEKIMELTQEYLRSILKYDLLTGDFTWRERRRPSIKKGAIAGTIFITGKGGKEYTRITIDGKRYFAHRLAFLYVLSVFPDDQVDHINGDGMDNRWINLRPVTQFENSKNQKLSSNNTSGCSGVSWYKSTNKWLCSIRVEGVYIYLGYFLNLKDAIAARKKAEKEHGFHENHGTERPL